MNKTIISQLKNLRSLLVDVDKFKNNSYIFSFHGVEYRIFDNDTQRLHINIKNFNDVIDFIAQNFDILPLGKLLELKKKKLNISNKVALTFDDGYNNNYEIAYPLLKKKNVPFTIFLISSFISTDNFLPTTYARMIINNCQIKEFYSKKFNKLFNLSNHKNKQLVLKFLTQKIKNESYKVVNDIMFELSSILTKSQIYELKSTYKSEKFMTWDSARKMSDYCSFGSHTQSHFTFNNMNSNFIEIQDEEIKKSKIKIIDELYSCDYFALPNGSRNSFTDSYNFSKYYNCVLTTKNKCINFTNDIFLPRISVDSDNSLANLKLKLAINVK